MCEDTRSTCPKCGCDLTTASFVQSTRTFQCPCCGADITNNVDVIDLRSDDVKHIEREAKSELTGEDEQFARKLVDIQRRFSQGLITEQQEKAETREIGKYLCANGGDPRMQIVGYRVMALGGSSRVLEIYWHGLCGWQM